MPNESMFNYSIIQCMLDSLV